MIELDDLKIDCESVICRLEQNLLSGMGDLEVDCEGVYYDRLFQDKYMWEQYWKIEGGDFEVDLEKEICCNG